MNGMNRSVNEVQSGYNTFNDDILKFQGNSNNYNNNNNHNYYETTSGSLFSDFEEGMNTDPALLDSIHDILAKSSSKKQQKNSSSNNEQAKILLQDESDDDDEVVKFSDTRTNNKSVVSMLPYPNGPQQQTTTTRIFNDGSLPLSYFPHSHHTVNNNNYEYPYYSQQIGMMSSSQEISSNNSNKRSRIDGTITTNNIEVPNRPYSQMISRQQEQQYHPCNSNSTDDPSVFFDNNCHFDQSHTQMKTAGICYKNQSEQEQAFLTSTTTGQEYNNHSSQATATKVSHTKSVVASSTSTTSDTTNNNESDRPNISTEYIRHLTTNRLMPPVAANDFQSKNNNTVSKSNSKRRIPRSEEERREMTRERNKEHARNTRLRKKAYVQELKRTLDEMVKQRDEADLRREQAEETKSEQREIWFRVLEEFLNLWINGDPSFENWNKILTYDFSLTIPFPSHRENNPIDNNIQLQRVLHGIDQVMNDSSEEAFFFKQLVGLEVMVACEESKFIMDVHHHHVALKWGLLLRKSSNDGTSDHHSSSSSSLLEERNIGVGLVQGTFCPNTNKIQCLDLCYDTCSLANLLQLHK